MAKKENPFLGKVPPRDGYDNTGTQGYDSLNDDGYTGNSEKPDNNPQDHESHTGSTGDDFFDADEEKPALDKQS